MTLIHHSPEAYGVAAKRAADWATQRLEQIIQEGRQNAVSTIAQVQRMQPRDYVVPGQGLKFKATEKRVAVEVQDRQFTFHPHATVQLGERCDMPNPRRTVEWLLAGPRGPQQLAEILTDRYEKIDKRFLVRTVNDKEIRGFLSDKFKRLDSAPIVEKFIERVVQLGAVPMEGRALDTKFFLKVVLPYILEPLPGEVMLWGALLKNSDFGDGKLEISGFVHRLRCTNLMIGEDGFAKVHLGGRIDENLELSQQTYQKETEFMASAVGDVVDTVFQPDNVRRRMETIQYLAKDNVDADAVLKGLRTKSKLTKEEAEGVAKLFSSAEIELLPPGQNAWRLSNAIALLAQKQEDPARQLELEELAGETAGLRKAANKPQEEVIQ